MKSETLKDSEIFRGLDDAQIEKLADLCDEESYRRGETIFNQGKKADKLFILVDGAVTLRIRAQKEIDLTATTVEKRGEVFGMAALLKPHRHQVTAQCSKVTNVLSIEGDEVFRMFERDYRMGFEVMKRVAEIYASRLNSTRSLITSLFKIFRVQTILTHDATRLWTLGGFFLGIMVLQAVCVFGMIYFAGTLGERVQYDLRKKMFDHLQYLSFSYYDRTPVGWIMARVTSDSGRIAGLISQGAR